MGNGINTSNFGPRAQQFIKAGNNVGGRNGGIFNADGTVNKANLSGVKKDADALKKQEELQKPKSNLKSGQANSFGGSFDWTA